MSADKYNPLKNLTDWRTHVLEQAGALAEAFFQVRPVNGSSTIAPEENPDDPPVEPVLPPLSLWEWTNLMDDEGRMSEDNYKQLIRYAFYGGFSEDIRPEAWKFLLGLYSYGTTRNERQILMRNKIADYNAMKLQWKTMLPEQIERCSKFRERRIQIEKDIIRTDRDYVYFKEEGALDILQDILLTFIQYNQDLGYAQGMNDLAALILNVLGGDEVCTFWCFANLMERLGWHFNKDQVGMTTTLRALARVLRVVDPELYDYFDSVDATNMFFCFRWMLVFFKREFSFDSTKRIWEALLSDFLSPHYEMFFACAMIEQSREVILTKHLQLDELMLMMNELAGKRRTTPLLLRSEEIYHTFMARKDVDPEIHDFVANNVSTISDAIVVEEPPILPKAPPPKTPPKASPPVYVPSSKH